MKTGRTNHSIDMPAQMVQFSVERWDHVVGWIMPFVRMRMLRSWLLGLYIVAQVAGVVPLMYDHTLNIYETKPVRGHVHLAIPNDAANRTPATTTE